MDLSSWIARIFRQAHGLIELRMSELSPDGKLGMKVDGVPTGLQVLGGRCGHAHRSPRR